MTEKAVLLCLWKAYNPPHCFLSFILTFGGACQILNYLTVGRLATAIAYLSEVTIDIFLVYSEY